ncbi:MAG: NADH-quinone oxidoreductase subunit M [Solirubrobacteraceae bacterium]|nr:NADH-quinone oxidoreductase subunit M [Solirubrobacteraceae bacterium]MDP4672836.1 NADH-quinone oxidoreductase subunit M [Solirubrobacteraceae bacterium]MDP4920693.1 NADH-quinone oxidoreductase subunit M [Solirubrobacteraceae bacterium]
MTIHLSIILWLPAVAGLLALLLPGRFARWISLLGSLLVLAYAITLLVDYDRAAGGLQYVTDIVWIRSLGIHYALGISGLNLVLLATTAVIFTASAIWTLVDEPDHGKPGIYALLMGLAQTAVMGAFLAQDLILFVVFFDLMLVPFYFLIVIWGGPDRTSAVLKLFMYTLVGSLLMLVGAITTGVLAANGGEPSFLLADLAKTPLGSTAQGWIFLAFALAFLIKMPSFPFHGWMPDGYSNMPIGVLAVFTAILSKVAAYGFLQIALPLFPDAAVRYQELIMIVAVASILYGSAMAFTVDSARLVLGYSSIAQLGFIVLGIFAFDGRGADGALLQATNHAIVAGALIFVVAMLARRAGGSEKLSDMGGIAKGAPAFAAVFLVFSFALLAMPGTANFVAEFMILLGTFESKMVFAFIAAIGVALAAFYALRLYISAMHHRVGAKVNSFELTLREGLVLVPLLLVVIALALYPQFALDPAEDATSRALSAAQQVQASGSETSTTAQGAK